MKSCILYILFATVCSAQEDEYEPIPDYYATLKVSSTATLKDIQRSFRKIAMKYHPDKNKEESAQEIFQQLSEAYSVLTDTRKRADYDILYAGFASDDSETVSDTTPVSETPPAQDYSARTTEKPEVVQPAESEVAQPDESADSTADEEPRYGDKSKDVWGDLDDDTLLKVLKFLADNDYEITKKLVKINAVPNGTEQRYYEDNQVPRYKRSAEDSFRHNFCETSVRWEENKKITLKTCY